MRHQGIVNKWSVYSDPSTRTNVRGCVAISVATVTTRSTMELGLTPSVGFIDMPASRAFSACVARVDKEDGHTKKSGFVCHKGSQLMERPIGHTCPLSASDLCPATDALEIFQSNAATGAVRICHDGLRDGVVSDPLEPGLLPLKSVELATSSARAFPLKVTPPVSMDTSDQFDFSATMAAPVAVGGDVDDAEVNADPVFRLKPLGLWNVACADQEPLAADISNIGLALAELHQLALPLAGNPRELNATVDGPKRHDVVGLEAHQPIVIRLSSESSKLGTNLSVGLESVSDLGDATNRRLSRQIKALATILVSKLVKIKLPDLLFLESALSKPRTRLVAPLKRSLERPFLLRGWLELYRSANLHVFKYRRSSALFQLLMRRAFLPAVNGRVSCAANR